MVHIWREFRLAIENKSRETKPGLDAYIYRAEYIAPSNDPPRHSTQ